MVRSFLNALHGAAAATTAAATAAGTGAQKEEKEEEKREGTETECSESAEAEGGVALERGRVLVN